MSASMLNMSVFRKFGSFWSYSRITYIRFHQRRGLIVNSMDPDKTDNAKLTAILSIVNNSSGDTSDSRSSSFVLENLCLQEAVSLPEAKYETDKQGNFVKPATRPFPQGLDVDPEVGLEFMEDKSRYPRQHRGIMHFRKAPRLPEHLVKNARLLLAEHDLIDSSSFKADVKHLNEVYLRRQPPIEERFKRKQIQIFKEGILAEEIEANGINFEGLNDAEKDKLFQRADAVARKIFKKSFHGWNQIEYKDHTGLVYLAARLAANYTVLLRIFNEIQKVDSDFVPESVLNVGSGIGSAVWAANNIWAEKVFEYYNVDISSYMNDVARKLLAKDIADPLNPTITGVHFRRQIPSPEHAHNRFPMVVSAYLLMEQSSLDDRLNLVSLLWELTDEYLVLVEHGTMAGYRLIMEAREIILQIGEDHPDQKGHIFAPCTHNNTCPKLQFKSLPCTFPIEYRKLNIGKERGQGDVKRTERYSYLVFKKGPKHEGKRYSRVTRSLHKSTHSHCQMCCPDGSLRQYVITKNKPSLALFKCAKKCQEGDFMPFQWPDEHTQAQKHGTEEQKNDTGLKSGIGEKSDIEELESGETEQMNNNMLQKKDEMKNDR